MIPKPTALMNAHKRIMELESKLGTFEDQRRVLEATEKAFNQVCDERDSLQSRLDQALEGGHEMTDRWMRCCEERNALESRLDSARKYCLDVIARTHESDEWRQGAAAAAANCLNELNGAVTNPVVERNDQKCLPASGSANTGSVAGRVIAERSTSDPSAGVDGADRESPQHLVPCMGCEKMIRDGARYCDDCYHDHSALV